MKKSFTPILFSAFLALACNSGSSGATRSGDKSSAEGLTKTQSQGGSDKTKTPPHRPHKLQGTFVLQTLAKEPEQTDATLDLAIDGQDKISGSLAVAGQILKLLGSREGSKLRCWIAPGDRKSAVAGTRSPEGDDHPVLAGVLFAEAKGVTWNGTISLSGSGGTPILKGSFQETLK